MKDFQIQSNYGSLLVAFTEECLEMGWKHNEEFSGGDVISGHTGKHNCIFFGDNFDRGEKGCCYACSGVDRKALRFTLPENWDAALAHAREYLEYRNEQTRFAEVEISTGDKVCIDRQQKLVIIEGAVVTFEDISNIHSLIKEKL